MVTEDMAQPMSTIRFTPTLLMMIPLGMARPACESMTTLVRRLAVLLLIANSSRMMGVMGVTTKKLRPRLKFSSTSSPPMTNR